MGEKLKFKRIVMDSNKYYGVNRVKGMPVHTLINKEEIESLRLHNIMMSVVYGIGTGIVYMIVGTTVLFAAVWNGPDLSP